MGCCFGKSEPKGFIEYEARIAKKPRIISNGRLLIPMNAVSGEFPSKYSRDFKKVNISKEMYTRFIREVNEEVMPLKAQQQLTYSLLKMNPIEMKQFESVIERALAIKLGQILQKWNERIFHVRGMVCETSLTPSQWRRSETLAIPTGIVVRKRFLEYLGRLDFPKTFPSICFEM